MIKTGNIYGPNDKMRSLIADNSMLLMAISRFDISLGFGNSTVAEACAANNVDCNTFLAIANHISNKDYTIYKVDIAALTNYLRRAHSYFLDFILPSIRRKLIDAIDCSGTDEVGFLIIKFFDKYVAEIRRHMDYENKSVFAHVERLIKGKVDKNFSIMVFATHHDEISEQLHALKDIIVSYYPGKGNDLLNSALFDIINCEQDLINHCLVEDNIFIPAVKDAEQNVEISQNGIDNEDEPGDDTDEEKIKDDRLEELSDREKEIISCIAKGMSNKDIADELCISVHTVTTHRRNISSKLQIHSPAGLTIFAITYKLVDLKDIKNVI
jgi:regulator of cell morphogenesis and NO signaling